MITDWAGKKVLVCGGAGMIGSHMAKRLVHEGADVTLADDLSSGSERNITDIKNQLDFRLLDLRDYGRCRSVAENKDCIFQFAADMGGIGYITAVGADIMRNSVSINLNMLQAAQQCGVTEYFYSSSACVYPEYLQTEAEVSPLKEADAYPAQPDQFYGWEKLFSELLAEAYQRDYGMTIHMARFHNIYGSMYTCFDQAKGKAPCHLILKAIRHPDPPFIVWGDGMATRSFLYIDDCVEAVLRLMGTDYYSPLNIGSDRLISVDGLARLIIGISGKQIDIQHDTTKPQGVRGRNADLQLAEQILKWRPQVSLEDGLEHVYAWAVDHFDDLEGI